MPRGERITIACSFAGCSYKCGFPSKLKRHERVHISDPKVRKPHECDKCAYRAGTISDLNKHRLCHSGEFPFVCSVPECDFKTKAQKNLELHMLCRHTKNHRNLVKCPLCPKRSLTVNRMQQHLLTHTNEKPWQCSFCQYKGNDSYRLRMHEEAIHGKFWKSREEGRLKCSVCNFVTSFGPVLKQHMVKHSQKRPYACSFPGCSYKAKQKQKLKIHGLTHVTQGYPCPQPGCDHVCKHKYTVRKHLETHKQNLFPCLFPGCNSEFRREIFLLRHQRFHDPRRSHKCNQCAQRFHKNSDLDKHFLRVHKEATVLDCPHCYKVITTGNKSYLRAHIQRIHPTTYTVCAEPGCNFRSFTAFDMLYHAKMHDKSRPFACELCPARFACKSSLKSHVKRHNSNSLKQFSVSSSSRAIRTYVRGRCMSRASGSVSRSQVSMLEHNKVHKEVAVTL